MGYMYNKDKIKSELNSDQVFNLLYELGGNPTYTNNDIIISDTICHNHINEGSHKLYYYPNEGMGLFHCYTGCEEPTFDIFELVCRVKSSRDNLEYDLPKAVRYVASYFGLAPDMEEEEETSISSYLTSMQKYDKIKEIEIKEQKADMKDLEVNFLQHMPQPLITPWLDEGITKEVMDYADIHYDPVNQAIVIPHYDVYGQLVGIRERTLIKENEIYGKYLPAKISGKMYNHPLSLNLYGLNWAKENIKRMRKAIVFESEKSVLMYMSWFGISNCIAVAVCGSSLSEYQVQLLKNAGAEEIIIAFDKCGSDDNNEIIKYTKKFYQFQKKYGSFVRLSFIYDKENQYLGLKDSPVDEGKDMFLKLFKERIELYDD